MPPLYQLNLNHLRYFYEVARAGNMRKAARDVGISQPALSKQIQALEDSIGLQLFYRSSKGLKPTSDGELVFGYCDKVFAYIHDLERALTERRTGDAGSMIIGSVNSIATYILPSYVRRFHQSYPEIRIKIMTTRSKAVLRGILEHKFDIGLISATTTDARFVWRCIMKTPLVVVTSPNSPLAHEVSETQAPLEIERLKCADKVAFDAAAPTRVLTEKYLAKHGVVPRIAAECPSIEAVVAMVESGVGYAVLPLHSVAHGVERGDLVRVPIKNWKLERKLYLVHLPEIPLAPPVRQFVSLFQKSPVKEG